MGEESLGLRLLRKPLGRIAITFGIGAFAVGLSIHRVIGDSSNVTASSDPKARPTALSRDAAALRSRQISQVSYTLDLDFDENIEEFKGRTSVQFVLKPKAKEQSNKVLLDLEGGTLVSLSINGKAIDDPKSTERFDGHHIELSNSELKSGSNRIEISYSHPYSKDGSGLHRFKDPVDQKVYLYSNFEPYAAHRMFPCFDQPDLKATYELTVHAPLEWQVISNTLPLSAKEAEGKKTWIFPNSASFSTYVFALHAGPYSTWKDDAEGIPLRLFARKSLAKYVERDQKEWLTITKQGLEFFNTQFNYPYPFQKYDQIIVPDFNSGATENVGAVTFSERYVYRTPVTQDKRRQRADTILHEMAHMWFGDLVTMRWWNGLWLNESFATFMASWAVDQATRFQGSWQAFFAGEKQWAYWEDQLVTTHPIEMPVPDTESARANFDGITYGKGAASLKQLSFYLGEDEFREGLQRYFQKFAYKNTALSDFMKMLSEASGKDVSQWEQAWLQTSGVTNLKVEWSCETDPRREKPVISKFNLIQSGEIRPHKTKIALFYLPKNKDQSGNLISSEPIDVLYKTPLHSVSEAIDKPCPEFVFPNYKDYDYAKLELDPVSLKFIGKNLSRIPDQFTRQMIWHTLWETVIDGKLRPQEFADIVLKHIREEKNSLVLSVILQDLIQTSPSRSSVLKFLEGKNRTRYQRKLEDLALDSFQNAPGGSDLQMIWYRAFLDSTFSPSSLKWIKGLLDGKNKVKGFIIDEERRWDLIQALARNGVKDVQNLIEDQKKKDSTDMGLRSAIAAEAAIPNPETKQKWLREMTARTTTETGNSLPVSQPVAGAAVLAVPGAPSPTPSESPGAVSGSPLPLAKLREAMRTYHNLSQEEWSRSAVDSYFETLPKLALSPSIEDQDYSAWFARLMFPALCETSVIEKTNQLLEKYPNLPASVAKSLKVHRQEEERCIRARKNAES